MGKNKKEEQKVKTSNGQQEQCAGGMNSDKQEANFATCENSQAAKILLRSFFFCFFFCHLSFWFLIYNVELDSNSSCLDRINNFGINSLQKLQN